MAARPPTPQTVSRDILNAAHAGDPPAAWEVYSHFHAYERAFTLPAAEQHALLLQSARAGHADAQFETAKLLRGGWLSLDGDTLRETDEHPTQANLNAARLLLDQAAAQGHERAQAMLTNLPPSEWHTQSVHRSPYGTHQPLRRDEHTERQDDEQHRRRNPLLPVLVAAALIALAFMAWLLFTMKVHDRLG